MGKLNVTFSEVEKITFRSSCPPRFPPTVLTPHLGPQHPPCGCCKEQCSNWIITMIVCLGFCGWDFWLGFFCFLKKQHWRKYNNVMQDHILCCMSLREISDNGILWTVCCVNEVIIQYCNKHIGLIG